MSDEFIKVATQEILEDIAKIDIILESCNDDNDVYEYAKNIQGHFHKIKGLAPMIGKSQVGEVAASFDSLMKQILDNKKLDDIYVLLVDSIPVMKNAMTASNCNLESLQSQLSSKLK